MTNTDRLRRSSSPSPPPSSSSATSSSSSPHLSSSLTLPHHSYSLLTHFRSLFTSLTPSTFASTHTELSSLLTLYGPPSHWHLLLTLTSLTPPPSPTPSPPPSLTLQLMRDVLRELVDADPFPPLLASALQARGVGGGGGAGGEEGYGEYFARLMRLKGWGAVVGVHMGGDEGSRMVRAAVQEVTGAAPPSVEGGLQSFLSLPSPLSPPQRRALVLALRYTDPTSSLYPSLTPLLSPPPTPLPPPSSSLSSPSSSLDSHRLSSLIRDLGYGVMASTSAFTEVLSMYGAVSEADVAMMVIAMLRTSDSLTPPSSSLTLPHILGLPPSAVLNPLPGETWSASTFVSTVWSLHPHLQWRQVLANLDHPAFIVPSPSALALLLALHRLASAEPFPLSMFLSEEWVSVKGRLSLLRWLCPLRWAVFPMHILPLQAAEAEEEEGGEGGAGAFMGGSSVLHAGEECHVVWWSMDVVRTLHDLRATTLHQQLTQALASASPSPFLASIAHGEAVHTPVALTLYLSSQALPLVLGALESSSALLHSALRSLLLHTPAFLTSLLTSAHSLLRLLSLSSPTYRDDMLHATTNKGQHHLHQYLHLCTQDHPTALLSSSLTFLSTSLATLSIAHLSTFFRHLYPHLSTLPPTLQSTLEDVYRRATTLYPTLPDHLLTSDDLHSTSLHYFNQLYSHHLTLPSFLSLLSTLKSSTSPRDRELYAAIVHRLFSSYPHLPSYPLPHLQLLSTLFGCLISSFLTSLLRALALKLVLDAIASPLTHYHRFAVWAMGEYRERLGEWPQWCGLVLEGGGRWLKEEEPGLWGWLKGVVEGEEGKGRAGEEGEQDGVRERLQKQLVPAMRTGWVGMSGGSALNREGGMMALSVGGEDGLNMGGAWLREDLPLEEAEAAAPLPPSFRPPPSSLSSPALSLTSASTASPMDAYSAPSAVRSQSGFAVPSFPSSRPQGLADLPTPSAGDSQRPGSRTAARDGSPSPLPAGDSRSPSPPPGLFGAGGGKALAAGLTTAMPSPTMATTTAPNPTSSAAVSTAPSPSSTALTSSTPPATFTAGPPTPSRTPSSSGPAPTFGSTLNIDSLLSASRDTTKPLPLAPSESIKDKIAFIINNVSSTNLRSKGRELKAILQPAHYAYFARYLVIQRVSIEANFQRLYAQFLDAVDLQELSKQMVETTYDNIKVLLSSDKVLSSSSERSLLKNLGSWLGLLTIAKNKPIRAKHLDLKQLILDAFDTGRLIAVIPFCAKVLESCAESKVFRVPNPWLVACTALLKEIFDIPGLKLNLKFEIEVLFRTLNIVMKDVRASNLLGQRAATSDFKGGGAVGGQVGGGGRGPGVGSNGVKVAGAAGKAKRPSSPSSSFTEESEEGSDALPGIPRASTPGGSLVPSNTNQFPPDASMIVPNLPTYVTISPTIPLFSMFAHLKRTVPTAVDRAIREIISPVVERSVTIACVTTRELMVKDFAMESDEGKMRAAAHSMVQNLTSSLALVTCKEPLRVSINNHLGSLLEANISNPSDPAIKAAIEAACSTISNDNLELGCTLIEKAAAERAIREIDEALASVYNVRRKAREAGTQYVDMSVFSGGRFPAALPEVLRVKPTGLTTHQLRVYEDFGRIRQHYQAVAAAPPATSERASQGKELAGATGAAPGGQVGGAMTEAELKRRMTGRASPPPQPLPALTARPPNALPPNSNTRSPPLDPSLPPSSLPSPLPPLTSQQMLEKLVGYLAQLEQAVLRFPNHKQIPLHSLTQAAPSSSSPPVREDHEIQVALRLISTHLAQPLREESVYPPPTPPPREVVALTFAHKVFKRLYDRENRTSLLQIDVHTQVLKAIRVVCPKVVTELTAWLLFGDDDRKFIIPITVALLRARLLASAEVDAFLNKLVLSLQASPQPMVTIANLPPPAPGVPSTPQVIFHQHLEFVFALIRRSAPHMHITPHPLRI